MIPLFFDINAKGIQCSQCVTPFVFNQISSANLMGFISVFTGDWFVKDIVIQSIVAILFDAHTGFFKVYQILLCKCAWQIHLLYILKSHIKKYWCYIFYTVQAELREITPRQNMILIFRFFFFQHSFDEKGDMEMCTYFCFNPVIWNQLAVSSLWFIWFGRKSNAFL